MRNELKIVSIKKIFSIIDSCTNSNQLKTCERLANNYTKLAEEKGVVNSEIIKESLDIKINEKLIEMELAFNF